MELFFWFFPPLFLLELLFYFAIVFSQTLLRLNSLSVSGRY